MKPWLFLLRLLAVIVVAGSASDLPAAAQDPPDAGRIALSPVADAFIDARHPLENFGTIPFLSLFGAKSGATLLRFDLASAPNGTVESAFLELFLRPSDAPRASVLVVAVAEPWEEGRVTWRTAPAQGEVIDTVAVDNMPWYKAWNVTKLVQAWLLGEIPNHGLALLVPEERGMRELVFDSREGTYAPRLRIAYRKSAPAPIPTVSMEVKNRCVHMGDGDCIRLSDKDLQMLNWDATLQLWIREANPNRINAGLPPLGPAPEAPWMIR